MADAENDFLTPIRGAGDQGGRTRNDFSPRNPIAFAWLTSVFTVCCWAFFAPLPYALCVAALVVSPVLLLAAVFFFPPLAKQRGDLGAAAVFAMWPALLLVMRAGTDVHLYAFRTTAFALAPVALGGAILFWIRRDDTRKFHALAPLAILGFAWSWGTLVEADALLDSSTAIQHPAIVVARWERGGRIPTDWVRLISPSLGVYVVEVNASQYEDAKVGAHLCIDVARGALGWRWYALAACERGPVRARPQPASA